MTRHEFKSLYHQAREFRYASLMGAQGLPCGADDAYLERRHWALLDWLDKHPIIKRVFEMRENTCC